MFGLVTVLQGLTRSYSLASLPREGTLELHVRRIPGGSMSGWLFDRAKPGDAVQLLVNDRR